MNANVSRDVITDLLPAYLAGEASEDTRTLIEAYMKLDPDLAAEVKRESRTLSTVSVVPATSRDREMEALRKTKRLIRRRTWYLVLAIFSSLCQVSYQFGPEGFKWTWQDAPAAAAVCALVGVFFWIAYFRSRRQLKPTGI